MQSLAEPAAPLKGREYALQQTSIEPQPNKKQKPQAFRDDHDLFCGFSPVSVT